MESEEIRKKNAASTPTTMCFGPVVLPRRETKVGGMGRPQRPRYGVVYVADFRGLIAVGKPAGHIPHPHELVESGGRPVPGLGFVGRTAQMPDLGARPDQFGQHRSGNDPAPRMTAADGGLTGSGSGSPAR